ncbi:MAG: thioredoxin fold domain-containing protein [Sulfuriferula sp.]
MIKYLHLVWFVLGVLISSGDAWSAPDQLVYTHNLQQDGRVAQLHGVPVLIVFTSPDCSYCELAMHEYLIPMQHNPQYGNKVLIRRIQITDGAPLVGWDGKLTTGKQYAATLGIKLTPTIIVFSPAGVQAAEPIVGLGSEDYYGGYLDDAIDAGMAKMHTATH